MNVLEIARKFPTQESCIAHLERAMWKRQAILPLLQERQCGTPQ